METGGGGCNSQNHFLPMFYHGVHMNSRLDFSDAPVSRGLALTGENYNFREWLFIAE
jgi:hypothetical protein